MIYIGCSDYPERLPGTTSSERIVSSSASTLLMPTPKTAELRSALRRYNRPTKSCRMATSDGSTIGGFTPPLKRVRAGHAQEELGQRPEEMPTFYLRFSPRFNPE